MGRRKAETPLSEYYHEAADEKQMQLHTHFVNDPFLGNPTTVNNFIEWVTFFRRNLHRFAIDYLGIKLHLYQIVILYLMGVKKFTTIIACRAAAKSFIIALYACCMCILYPNSMVVISSGSKGQSKLIVSEKIQKELMGMSPVLRREIKKIHVGQDETIVIFQNNSSITVVCAHDRSRGWRSTILVREEFRQIKKFIDDSVLSPFQIIRQTGYLHDPYYDKYKELEEEPINVYISSSWYDDGTNWMWDIVDQTYGDMMRNKDSCLLAFDESVPLKHKIKTLRYFQTEKKKQDPMTWQLEFMNTRLKENRQAFFTYSLIKKNQKSKQPFYPRTLIDYKTGKRNPYSIPKQKNEIRIVSCDMAFVTNDANDNSIFSCIRLLPEKTTYKREKGDLDIDNGYRRIVPYLEHHQGGDTTKQAVRIRQLFSDFKADYIVLDLRNAGIAIYDMLAKVMYDEERGVEYSPLSCMNDENVAKRIQIEGSTPCIYVINASQKLNSDIALDFRRVLDNERIDLLCTLETALEDILPNVSEYNSALDGETQSFYETPFLETQAFISETMDLVYEKKEQTGAIVIHEQGSKRKDRYTSISYGSYFASQLEQDLLSKNEEYEYTVLVN